MKFLTLVGALASQFAFSSAFLPSAVTQSVAAIGGRKSTILCKAEKVATTNEVPTTNNDVLDSFLGMFNNNESSPTNNKIKGGKFLMAQSLLLSLINDDKCFTTIEGAQKFAESCAVDIVYEDCYEPQPIVGRAAVAEHLKAKAAARGNDAGFRIDKISDGSSACGYAWTWTSNSLEGLRGTTFVELNSSNQIQYVREIPEPIYKPGDLILEVLKAATADATPKSPPDYVSKTPKTANEIAKYLFNDVQGADSEEAMRFFDESIIYRDFNYEEVLNGKE